MHAVSAVVLLMLAILAFLSVALVVYFLTWVVLKLWVGYEEGFTDKLFDATQVWIYLTIQWNAFMDWITEVVVGGAGVTVAVGQHLMTNWRTYLFLSFVVVGGYGVSKYDDEILSSVDKLYSKFVSFELVNIVYPILNLLRLIYDVVVPFWDTLVRIWHFWGLRLIALTGNCALDSMFTAIRSLGETVAGLARAMADWMNGDPALDSWMIAKPLSRLAETVQAAVDFAGCLCHKLHQPLDILVAKPFRDMALWTSLDAIVNASFRIFQQIVLAVRSSERMTFTPFFVDLQNGIILFGRWVDGIKSDIYLEALILVGEVPPPLPNANLLVEALIDVDGNLTRRHIIDKMLTPTWAAATNAAAATEPVHSLPETSGIVTRPIAAVIAAVNFTLELFIHLPNVSVAGYGNISCITTQIDEFADTLPNVTMTVLIVLDVRETSPEIFRTAVALSEIVRYVVRFVVAFVKSNYDGTLAWLVEFVDILKEAVNDPTVFDRRSPFEGPQRLWYSGDYEPIFENFRAVTLFTSVATRVLHLPPPDCFTPLPTTSPSVIEPVISFAGNAINCILRAVLGAFVNMNHIVTRDPRNGDFYLQSFEFNHTVNGVFENTTASLGYLALGAERVAWYVACSEKNPNFRLPNGLVCRHANDPNDISHLVDRPGTGIYWAQFFCCSGELLTNFARTFLSLLRSAVLTAQNSIPPTSGIIVNQFDALRYALKNLIVNLHDSFIFVGCTTSYADPGGMTFCGTTDRKVCTSIPSLQNLFTTTPAPTERKNLQNAVGQIGNILLIPLAFTDKLLDVLVAGNNSNYAMCIDIFDLDRQQERVWCVQNVTDDFFTRLVAPPLANTVMSLGFWLNCITDGLGFFFVELSCLFQSVVEIIRTFLAYALLLTLDIIKFFSFSDIESSVNALALAFLDAVELIVAVLKAVANIVWQRIIVPIINGLIRVAIALCKPIATVVNFFVKKKNEIDCKDIEDAYSRTFMDPMKNISINATADEIHDESMIIINEPINDNYLFNTSVVNDEFDARVNDVPPSASSTPSRTPTASRTPSRTPSPSRSPQQMMFAIAEEIQRRHEEAERNDNDVLIERQRFPGRFSISPERNMVFNRANFPDMKLHAAGGVQLNIEWLSDLEKYTRLYKHYNGWRPETRAIFYDLTNMTRSLFAAVNKTVENAVAMNISGAAIVSFRAGYNLLQSIVPRVNDSDGNPSVIRGLGRMLMKLVKPSFAVELTQLVEKTQARADALWQMASAQLRLTDCLVLDQLITVVLQQCCAMTRYYAPESLFFSQVDAFTSLFRKPYSYNGTTFPEFYRITNESFCPYLGSEEMVDNLTLRGVPNIPPMPIYYNSTADARFDAFCAHSDSLNCVLNRMLKSVNINLNTFFNDTVVPFMFGPPLPPSTGQSACTPDEPSETTVSESDDDGYTYPKVMDDGGGLDSIFPLFQGAPNHGCPSGTSNADQPKRVLSYVWQIFSCNYGTNIECRNSEGLGLSSALWAVYLTLTVLSLLSWFDAVPVPTMLLMMAWMASPYFVLLLAYLYSPFCFPALPVCLADDIIDTFYGLVPPCIRWPEGMIKHQVNTSTCPEITFYSARDDLGIYDGLDNLAVFVDNYAPGAVRFMRKTPGLFWLYDISFIREPLDKFYYEGNGVPDNVLWGAWVTSMNVALVVFLFAGLLLGAQVVFVVVIRPLTFFVASSTVNLLMLFTVFDHQMQSDFVNSYGMEDEKMKKE